MKRIVKLVLVAILMVEASSFANAYNYETDIAQNVSRKTKNNKSKDRLSWLDGNWRYKMSYLGITQEVQVRINGNSIVVFMNGERYYAGEYSIDGNVLRYNRRNGSADILYLDRTNKRLMVDKGTPMERF